MPVIETQTFRLVDRSDLDGFLEADRTVQTELMLQKPTFLRRTTARSSDGEWIVLVLWASEDDANTSDQRFADAPANARSAPGHGEQPGHPHLVPPLRLGATGWISSITVCPRDAGAWT